MKRSLVLFAILTATGAQAVPFTITLTNTSTTVDYDWAPGLLTIGPGPAGLPLINLGLTPQSPSNQWFTYLYANSNCPGTDEGNAALLASRWGLTLGTNAWIVPGIPAQGGAQTITIDAPVGSRLSYIAWVNSTAVFDDFVALHPPGDVNTLSVPLFNGSTPVENVDFAVTGYDINSTSPTDGSGPSCTTPSQCPTATTGCYVSPGNASAGSGGSFPIPPTPNVDRFTITTSATQNRLWWTNIGPHQGVVVVRNTAAGTSWVPTAGVTYLAGQQVGGVAATGTITTIGSGTMNDGETLTLNDGINVPTVFEFDTGTSVVAGRIRIPLSGNATAMGTAIVTAINSVGSSLWITATSAGSQPRVLLTNDLPGTAGIQAISDTVGAGGFTTTGMTGGTNLPPTVVYVDNDSGAAKTFTDTGVTAGARYFYRNFAHANSRVYATGSVPSSTGLFSEVTSGASPKWCYSVGFASMQQPVTQLGTTVFTSNAGGTVTANITSPSNPFTDGNERWRPVKLGGTTQSRPLYVPTQIGTLLLTGDFSGKVTAINAATGAVVWQSAQLGDRVQGQPVAQLLNFVGTSPAGVTFANANLGRDLIFVGTRNSLSTTNNKVFALSSVNGSTVWTYSPGNLDFISGGMAVDYANNRLYVGANNGLRILDSVTGAQVASMLVGESLQYGVNLDFVSGVATSVYAVSVGGTAYGINLATMTQTFSSSIGATSSWIFPTGNGFVAPMSSGAIRRYAVSGATVTQLWERAGIGVPSGATIDYGNAKIYTGTSTGTLRQIDFNDGGLDRTLTVTTLAPTNIGFPTLDTSVGRLHVGTMDGRVCAFPIPLP